MLTVGGTTRIWLCAGATDLRRGFNGLHALIVHQFGGAPLSGDLFVFTNRRRDLLKIFFFEAGGIWICAKRLERGTFGCGPTATRPAPCGTIIGPINRLSRFPRPGAQGRQLQGPPAHGRGRGPGCDRPAGAGHLPGVLRPPSEVFFKAHQAGELDAGPYFAAINRLFRVDRLANHFALTLENKARLRSCKSLPIFDALVTRAQAASLTVLPKSLLGEGLHYLLAQREPLRRCLEKAKAELSTNAVERAIRPLKIGAKTWLHVGHPKAGPYCTPSASGCGGRTACWRRSGRSWR